MVAKRYCLLSVASLAFVLLSSSLCLAIQVGDKIGPYTVIRIMPTPPGGMGDLEFAEDYLYSLESYDGNIHKLDPMTAEVLADYWVPGESLHDDMPYDAPEGLAWDGNNFFMTSRAPDWLRKLTLGDPPNVTVEWMVGLPDWPMDLAYGNGFLYYPEYLGPIRKVDPATGDVVDTLPSPSDYIYGMTFDGENLIGAYGVGGGERTFWVISPDDGSIVDIWTVPGWQTGMEALAYDLADQTMYIGSGDGIVVAALCSPSSTDQTTWGSLKSLFK